MTKLYVVKGSAENDWVIDSVWDTYEAARTRDSGLKKARSQRRTYARDYIWSIETITLNTVPRGTELDV